MFALTIKKYLSTGTHSILKRPLVLLENDGNKIAKTPLAPSSEHFYKNHLQITIGSYFNVE